MADENELEPGTPENVAIAPATPGEKLRAAREARGFSLADVATRTRIAQRQLEAIERDDYEALPGVPYAIGFSRAFARAVELDEVAIAAEVRRAVSASDLGANRYEAYEPADPARVPSRTLAWTLAAVVILVVGAYAIWRTQILTPPTGEQIAEEQAPAAAPARAPAGAAATPAAQPVVFTAVDDVWLRIYDEAGERLKDGLLKKGERFVLPPNARNPMILTGRPQALVINVGDKTIPPLGDPDRTIADVPVSAGALLARLSAAPATTPSAGAGGTASALSAPSKRPSAPRPARQDAPADSGATTSGASVTNPAASNPAPAASTPSAATPAPAATSSSGN
jgi:cytoskeletal protein RodZ